METVSVTLAQTGGGASALGGLLPFLLIIVVFYFLLIRPQQNRAKKQRQLVSSLGPNDRVVTIGGIHGTIMTVDEDTVRLEISPGTVITFAKAAVARRLIDADDDVTGTTGFGLETRDE